MENDLFKFLSKVNVVKNGIWLILCHSAMWTRKRRNLSKSACVYESAYGCLLLRTMAESFQDDYGVSFRPKRLVFFQNIWALWPIASREDNNMDRNTIDCQHAKLTIICRGIVYNIWQNSLQFTVIFIEASERQKGARTNYHKEVQFTCNLPWYVLQCHHLRTRRNQNYWYLQSFISVTLITQEAWNVSQRSCCHWEVTKWESGWQCEECNLWISLQSITMLTDWLSLASVAEMLLRQILTNSLCRWLL